MDGRFEKIKLSSTMQPWFYCLRESKGFCDHRSIELFIFCTPSRVWKFIHEVLTKHAPSLIYTQAQVMLHLEASFYGGSESVFKFHPSFLVKSESLVARVHGNSVGLLIWKEMSCNETEIYFEILWKLWIQRGVYFCRAANSLYFSLPEYRFNGKHSRRKCKNRHIYTWESRKTDLCNSQQRLKQHPDTALQDELLVLIARSDERSHAMYQSK